MPDYKSTEKKWRATLKDYFKFVRRPSCDEKEFIACINDIVKKYSAIKVTVSFGDKVVERPFFEVLKKEYKE